MGRFNNLSFCLIMYRVGPVTSHYASLLSSLPLLPCPDLKSPLISPWSLRVFVDSVSPLLQNRQWADFYFFTELTNRFLWTVFFFVVVVATVVVAVAAFWLLLLWLLFLFFFFFFFFLSFLFRRLRCWQQSRRLVLLLCCGMLVTPSGAM